jgi:branched-chain amino acid transport system substrate-binding protein
MKGRTGAIAALLALTVALAVVAGAVAATNRADGSATAAALATQRSCISNARIGFSGPLTGDAGFLGQEQLSWAQFALSRFNKANKTTLRIVQGDTQLDPALSTTVSRQFVSNSRVLGMVGPSTSQGVISSKDAAQPARLAMVSPSATRPSLTTGKREGGTTFFRNVPHDDVQGPTIANYIINKLKFDDVVIVETRANPYSTALSDIVAARLNSANKKVTRLTVEQGQTDYSTTVTRVPNTADIVVLPWQQPPDAQTFANQLRLQGKRAIVFGSDGTYSPDQFKPTSGYASSFAPDLHFVPAKATRAIVAAYNRFSRNKTFGTFGPPSYMSTMILGSAIKKACANSKATRAEVLANVKKTNMQSITGGKVKFNAVGDVSGAKFFVFRITNGTYRPAP